MDPNCMNVIFIHGLTPHLKLRENGHPKNWNKGRVRKFLIEMAGVRHNEGRLFINGGR